MGNKRKTPLEIVAKAAGSKYRLAQLLEIKPQTINGWRLRGQIPAGRVLQIEKLVGVPRHVQRPDIYPAADYAGLKAAG